jgi:hypothetical protein
MPPQWSQGVTRRTLATLRLVVGEIAELPDTFAS